MRALVWRGMEEWLAEHAQVDLHEDGVLATGVQLGVEPEPYLLEWEGVSGGRGACGSSGACAF